MIAGLMDRVRRNEPLPMPLDWLLTAATPVYRAGMLLRSLSKPVRVNARVVSFGNLTAGGTGKTPAVIERAQEEVRAGRRVGILTRGYGARERIGDRVLVVDGGDAIASQMGDEPALIGKRVPDVILARASDRVRAAQYLVERHRCDVLLMDDGFQYVRLARDEDVLLINANDPFGNGRLIPRGLLREPVASMARATHIVLTYCDRVSREQLEELKNTVSRYAPNAPVRMTRHAPDSLWNVATAQPRPLDTLRDADVRAVCAIAAPEQFVQTLESLGATVSETRFFPDHAEIPRDALLGDRMTIVTEKDAVRLENAPENVFALGIRLEDCQNC